MKVKFTQFFDISSNSTKFTKFTVTAGGEYVKARCVPQFMCYKYYKLGPVKVKLVPASTLPVDPTGLSYEAGETTVDPRDMFNPGLVRITNGENVGEIGDMDSYYATLLDTRWFKFQLQQGFSRTAKPLVYNIGEISQDGNPFQGFITGSNSDPQVAVPIAGRVGKSWPNDITNAEQRDFVSQHMPIQTGRIRLGWMPTTTVLFNNPVQNELRDKAFSIVPEIDLITFILPQAYKTKFYYRVFIESTVYFKEPVAVNPVYATKSLTMPGASSASDKPVVYQPIDMPRWSVGPTYTPGSGNYVIAPQLGYDVLPGQSDLGGADDDLS